MLDFVCLLVFTYAKTLNGILQSCHSCHADNKLLQCFFLGFSSPTWPCTLFNTFFSQLFFNEGRKKYRDSTRLLPIATINGHGRQSFTNPVTDKRINLSLCHQAVAWGLEYSLNHKSWTWSEENSSRHLAFFICYGPSVCIIRDLRKILLSCLLSLSSLAGAWVAQHKETGS